MKADATNHTVSWFKREADAETLDLSPTFQRRPVWDDDQASYLIDSILRELPIPEVYIRLETDAEGNEVHSVIDGQQRIRSILRFAQNDLVLESKDMDDTYRGLSYSDLDEETQRPAFWSYKLVVRQLVSASDDDIKDLFRRVNINSVVLNDQELRHAHYEGHFISLAQDLADDAWWVERKVFTVREIRRMLDVEFISELIVGMMAGPQDKKSSLDDYYLDYDAEFEDEDFWRKQFIKTQDVIDDLFETGIGNWRSKSEFYSLFLVVADLVYNDQRFPASTIEAIAPKLLKFRQDVDQAKKKANTKRFPRTVHVYADAVTRAATDLSRRATRDSTLREVIRSAIPSK